MKCEKPGHTIKAKIKYGTKNHKEREARQWSKGGVVKASGARSGEGIAEGVRERGYVIRGRCRKRERKSEEGDDVGEV
jgi:hypothetical protein